MTENQKLKSGYAVITKNNELIGCYKKLSDAQSCAWGCINSRVVKINIGKPLKVL
jgi:hypothetical protein